MYDLAVIGGGIVGLGLLRAARQAHPDWRLLLLEKEAEVGRHQTGHNSGVVHSGIYYKPGSLKARLCVQGAAEMQAYCRSHDLPLATPGKLIVATQGGQLAGLAEIERRGQANGVAGVRRLHGAELSEIEPAIRGIAALHVPGVSITDYARVARCLAAEAGEAGAEIVTRARVTGLGERAGECIVESEHGDFRARRAVNCAGLFADRLCRRAGGRPGASILPFRGEYYQLKEAAAARVRGLVYPVPDAQFPFLGVHFTPRVQGGVEAGPNAVLATAREGYSRADWSWADVAGMVGYRGFWAMAARYWKKGWVEQYRSLSRAAYLRALRELMPELAASDLTAGGSGVRAQLIARNGRMVDDFFTLQQGRVLHVLNVPSPAATASLAIGRHLEKTLTGGAA